MKTGNRLMILAALLVALVALGMPSGATLAASKSVAPSVGGSTIPVRDFTVSPEKTKYTMAAGTSKTFFLLIHNLGDSDEVIFAKSVSPQGWTHTLSDSKIFLPARGYAKTALTVSAPVPTPSTNEMITVYITNGETMHTSKFLLTLAGSQ